MKAHPIVRKHSIGRAGTIDIFKHFDMYTAFPQGLHHPIKFIRCALVYRRRLIHSGVNKGIVFKRVGIDAKARRLDHEDMRRR